MIDGELVQNVLNVTIERMGKQTIFYEAEIANLNAQIISLNKRIEELSNNKEL